jgi:hypothetical protein
MECIFCNGPASSRRAKEHIIPSWALEEFQIRQDMVTPTHFSESGEIVSERLHNMDSFLAGRVCSECNGGWMARLETENKPLIIELARGRRDIHDLSDEEAESVARWGFKTAVCLHAAANWRKIVPESHYAHLGTCEPGLPAGVRVVGKTTSLGNEFSWVQSTSWWIHQDVREISNEEIQRLKTSAYKICVQLLGLIFLVAYNPLEGARDVLWKYTHVPLWPRRGPVSWLTWDRVLPSEHLSALVAYHHTFGLAPQADRWDR